MAGPSLEGLVNATLLEWARTSSRLSIDDASKKIGVKAERLAEWEVGKSAPTMPQLRNAAEVYKRAVTFFFLDKKPAEARAPTDFRRIELSTGGRVSPELANAIRDAQAKRDAALDIFSQSDETPPKFSIRIKPGTDPELAAEYILDRLKVTAGPRHEWADEYAALRGWKNAIEKHGVLVMQVSGIDLEEMRGCALALNPLPIILLNSKDSPLGRVFTLLHELTHLARNEWSLCDISDDLDRRQISARVEKYCNHVAGAAMIPRHSLLRTESVAAANVRSNWSTDELLDFRSSYWASEEVVLRRLLTLKKTSLANYQRARAEFVRRYAAIAAARAKGRPPFVPFYRKVVLGNGRYLTGLVLDAYDSQVITGSELSRILGTKLDHLSDITSEVRRTT